MSKIKPKKRKINYMAIFALIIMLIATILPIIAVVMN